MHFTFCFNAAGIFNLAHLSGECHRLLQNVAEWGLAVGFAVLRCMHCERFEILRGSQCIEVRNAKRFTVCFQVRLEASDVGSPCNLATCQTRLIWAMQITIKNLWPSITSLMRNALKRFRSANTFARKLLSEQFETLLEALIHVWAAVPLASIRFSNRKFPIREFPIESLELAPTWLLSPGSTRRLAAFLTLLNLFSISDDTSWFNILGCCILDDASTKFNQWPSEALPIKCALMQSERHQCPNTFGQTTGLRQVFGLLLNKKFSSRTERMSHGDECRGMPNFRRMPEKNSECMRMWENVG